MEGSTASIDTLISTTTTEIGNMAGDILGGLAGVVPYALLIAGGIIAVTLLVRTFKKVGK